MPKWMGSRGELNIWLYERGDDLNALLNHPLTEQVWMPPGVWEVDPITIFRSNVTLSLDTGTVLRARRGTYGSDHQIIRIMGANVPRPSNVRILGPGAEYGTSLGFWPDETYTGGRRHAIAVYNADDVILAGFNIDRTYGDGITIGSDGELVAGLRRSRRVLVEDVTFDLCPRNGISLVSGEDITFRRLLIKNVGPFSAGVADSGPWAGVDIEPDASENSLKNILLEDVTVEDAQGAGINIELANAACDQDEYTATIQVTRPVVTRAGATGIRVRNAFDYLEGSITIDDAEISDTQHGGLVFRDKSVEGLLSVTVNTATIVRANRDLITESTEGDNYAPIVVWKQVDDLDFQRWRSNCGALTLNNVTVLDNRTQYIAWLEGRADGFVVEGVAGTLRGAGTIYQQHVGTNTLSVSV